MWVKITKDVDHRVRPVVIQAFRAGGEHNLPKATAEALIASGSATPIKTEKKEKANGCTRSVRQANHHAR